MALTLTQDYKDALGTSFQENWLFEIRNNTYSSGSATTEYIRLGTIESGSGNSKYNAFITNQPTLRESIDLEKGNGKVGGHTKSHKGVSQSDRETGKFSGGKQKGNKGPNQGGSIHG